MKVMHVLNTGAFSGAENVAISIITYLNMEIESVYVSPEGSIGDILNKNNIHYYPIKHLSLHNLRRAITSEKPDIIHAHDFTASIISAICGGAIPVISHLHNNPPWIKKICFKSIVYGVSCIKYDKIFVVSESILREYIFGEKIQKKVQVIGNPILTKQIKKKALQAERKSTFDIVFLGRFTLQKDPEAFLNIIKCVREKLSSISVAMIGTGEMFDEIQEKIKIMNLGDTIKCLGFIDNPYGILCRSKLLCIPSRWEGFGLVAIEALALGKPVVAANVGGLPNIVSDGCGKICNCIEEYVDEIVELLRDENYYKQASEEAVKRSLVLDNEKTFFENIQRAYESCELNNKRIKT